MTSPCIEGIHCRSLSDLRLELRAERYTTLLAHAEAFNAGCDTVAAHHAREIARIDERLREIEGAENV